MANFSAPHTAVGVCFTILSMLASPAGIAAQTTRPGGDDAVPRASMFPKGTWTMEYYGGYIHSVSQDENVSSGVVAGGYYFGERHALRAEVVGSFLDNDGTTSDADDSVAGGLNLGLRFHFLEHEGLTLFFEGIAGMFYGARNFPEGGTHFNFNEQLGLGATIRLDEHAHFFGGARYMHISNARIHGEDENPSFDGVGGFIGMLFTY
jgi:hypothetical protein